MWPHSRGKLRQTRPTPPRSAHYSVALLVLRFATVRNSLAAVRRAWAGSPPRALLSALSLRFRTGTDLSVVAVFSLTERMCGCVAVCVCVCVCVRARLCGRVYVCVALNVCGIAGVSLWGLCMCRCGVALLNSAGVN